MNFYIQTSNPYIINETNAYDNKLSEAIESVFPMNTEELILFWNHVGIPLSYKYDISYMIDDILMILKNMEYYTDPGSKSYVWKTQLTSSKALKREGLGKFF